MDGGGGRQASMGMPAGSSLYALPGATFEPTADLEMSVECNNLDNMDCASSLSLQSAAPLAPADRSAGALSADTSKSDPMAVVFSKDAQGQWREVGRTETIMDTLNPKFAKSFQVQYFFERTQWFRYEVYDVDESSRDLSKHDFIGRTAEVRLCDVVAGHGRKTFPLNRPGKRAAAGALTVVVEEMEGAADLVNFKLRGRKLANMDGWFGKSDPFVVLHRQVSGNWVKFHESAPIMNNLDPSWPAFSCTSRHVNGNDKQRPILFEVWDYESSGSHQMIGHFTTTLLALEAGEVREGKLLHPQGKKKDVGTLVFESVAVEKSYSFCDYLMGGCEVSLMAAVDFTASNGDPRQPGTLHHTSPHAKNEYEQAIDSVGSIVVAYVK